MDFSQILDKRRAVNFFDPDRDVPEELVRRMVTMAAKTPSSFNLQPWNLIILREREEKMKLRGLAWDQPKVSEAPVTMIVLADRNGWQAGHPTVERNFKEMVAAGGMKPEQYDWFTGAAKGLYGATDETALAFAAKNTGFYAMSLMYAATSLGLDTHPMDGFDREGVAAAFHIPKNYWIPLLLSVGYFAPGKELHAPKWRKGYEDIVVRFD
ncbi:MAG: nitroreductase family protein [Desulfovibrionaceae bacterium]